MGSENCHGVWLCRTQLGGYVPGSMEDVLIPAHNIKYSRTFCLKSLAVFLTVIFAVTSVSCIGCFFSGVFRCFNSGGFFRHNFNRHFFVCERQGSDLKMRLFSIFYTQKSNILIKAIAIILKIIYNKCNIIFIKLIGKGGHVLFAKYIIYR